MGSSETFPDREGVAAVLWRRCGVRAAVDVHDAPLHDATLSERRVNRRDAFTARKGDHNVLAINGRTLQCGLDVAHHVPQRF